MLLVLVFTVGTHIVAETLVAEVLSSCRLVFATLFGLGTRVLGVEESAFSFVR
jgi:hypothetical protein